MNMITYELMYVRMSQGINIRHKVRELIDFIQDDDKLRDERKKAKKNKDKYIGEAPGTGTPADTTPPWSLSYDTGMLSVHRNVFGGCVSGRAGRYGRRWGTRRVGGVQ